MHRCGDSRCSAVRLPGQKGPQLWRRLQMMLCGGQVFFFRPGCVVDGSRVIISLTYPPAVPVLCDQFPFPYGAVQAVVQLGYLEMMNPTRVR